MDFAMTAKATLSSGGLDTPIHGRLRTSPSTACQASRLARASSSTLRLLAPLVFGSAIPGLPFAGPSRKFLRYATARCESRALVWLDDPLEIRRPRGNSYVHHNSGHSPASLTIQLIPIADLLVIVVHTRSSDREKVLLQ
ncbi:hypothetical protein KRMM14A1259_43040 [Krasilnikovia sp. MM14-A1259]